MQLILQNATIQNSTGVAELPTEALFSQWVEAALRHLDIENLDAAEVCIRLVEAKEIADLNQRYRHKAGATNVLSFPQELPLELAQRIVESDQALSLGDIVLCAPIVAAEAAQQGKSTQAHWAHLTLHGTLHLLGLDHIQEEEAQQMEAIEIAILDQLGFANPY